jgi:hypothetical protein
MVIRAETEADHEGVRVVNEAAFETPQEAELVDVLRQEGTPIVSLVAEEGGSIVGHILFSPASLEGLGCRSPGSRRIGNPTALKTPKARNGAVGEFPRGGCFRLEGYGVAEDAASRRVATE